MRRATVLRGQGAKKRATTSARAHRSPFPRPPPLDCLPWVSTHIIIFPPCFPFPLLAPRAQTPGTLIFCSEFFDGLSGAAAR